MIGRRALIVGAASLLGTKRMPVVERGTVFNRKLWRKVHSVDQWMECGTIPDGVCKRFGLDCPPYVSSMPVGGQEEMKLVALRAEAIDRERYEAAIDMIRAELEKLKAGIAAYDGSLT